MNDKLSKQIKVFKELGVQFTLDGFAVADLLIMLDDAVEVNDANFVNNRLSVQIGEVKADRKQVLALVAQASLLGAITAGIDDSEGGTKLWFEWMLPKDFYYEKNV